jgi:4-hydroxyphenylpyruvate dioxygenase
MRRDQLAINSVSTRHSNLREALDAYAAAGFHQVEFTFSHVKSWLAAGHTVADVRNMLAERTLHCVGGFEAPVTCFGAPPDRHANQDLQVANAQLIHDLGGGTLVVGTDGPQQLFANPLEALDPIAESLGMLARRIEGLQVTIALEFNWSPVIRSLQSAIQVVDRVHHPQVGVLFDTAHYYVTPTKLEDLTAESVRRIAHVHLNDMRDKPGDMSHCNSDRVLPGQGVLDLPALVGRLEACGYRGPFSIEMFNADLWTLPPGVAALQCYESLLPLCI